MTDLVRNPRLLDAVEDLIGPDILCWTSQWWIKEPHSPQFVSWHQDSNYWGLDTDHLVSAWVALSPATVESGCMRFMPGSHLGPRLPHRETWHDDNMLSRGQAISAGIDEARAVNMEVATGEAVLFSYRLAHASHPNRSDDRRIGIAIRYMPPDARQTLADWDSATLVRGEDQVRLLRARADAGLRLRSGRGRVPQAHGTQPPPHRLPRHGPDGAPHLARLRLRGPMDAAAGIWQSRRRLAEHPAPGSSGIAAMEDLPYSESDTITVGGGAMSAAAPDFDPMLLSVLSSRFGAILREMSNGVLRASKSGVIKIARDMSCAILTYDHRLVCIEECIPVHAAAIDLTTRPLTEFFDDIEEGDAFLNNCPYTGVTHHADLTLCVPVFFNGKPLFWTVSRAHHADVGAPIPSTYLPYAKTIFEEGLHFPGVRVERGYKEIRDIIRMAKIKVQGAGPLVRRLPRPGGRLPHGGAPDQGAGGEVRTGDHRRVRRGLDGLRRAPRRRRHPNAAGGHLVLREPARSATGRRRRGNTGAERG